MNVHEFILGSLLLINDPSVTASSVPSQIALPSHESLPTDFTFCHNHVFPHFSRTSHKVVASTSDGGGLDDDMIL